MKNWFPFTDYDFYAYITAGVIVIAGIDYAFFEGTLSNRDSWTLVQGIFWTMVSYLVGHLIAGLSSLFFQQILFNLIFAPPALIILKIRKSSWFERIFKWLFAQEYSPLPEVSTNSILEKLASAHNCQKAELHDAEAIFQTAFAVARYEPSSEARLNSFMNLYGFCRNTSFSFLLVAGILTYKIIADGPAENVWLLVTTLAMGFGMFGRYLKFYSAYTREILRTFARTTS